MLAMGGHSTCLVTPADRGGPSFHSSSQTLVVGSPTLSLTHIFILKPITETLLGLIQVQS